MSDGSDSEEETPFLEEYFLLRLKNTDAQCLREMMENNPAEVEDNLFIEFEDQFEGANLYMNEKMIKLNMGYIPTIIDVNKTTNGVNLFKTGNISQIFVANDAFTSDRIQDNHNFENGMTSPLKNVSSARFRRVMRYQENSNKPQNKYSNVQREVDWLLRTDSLAVNSRFELIYGQKKKSLDDLTKEDLFGDVSESEDSSDPHNDIFEY